MRVKAKKGFGKRIVCTMMAFMLFFAWALPVCAQSGDDGAEDIPGHMGTRYDDHEWFDFDEEYCDDDDAEDTLPDVKAGEFAEEAAEAAVVFSLWSMWIWIVAGAVAICAAVIGFTGFRRGRKKKESPRPVKENAASADKKRKKVTPKKKG